MRGLYAIIDADLLNAERVPLIPFAERLISARPSAVQLRAKHASPRDTLDSLRRLRELCTRVGVALFANDRPDLAVLARADGVHVGQEDPSVSDVRRFAPNLLVGVSTHHEEQLRAALADKPDYVAFGPVFPTNSKERPDPAVGVAALASAGKLCRAAEIPLVAIGGIDVDRAPLVAEHADLIAVIRALLPPEGLDGVVERARALHDRSTGLVR